MKKYLALILVLIGILVASIILVNKSKDSAGNSANMTTPEPLERTIDCEVEIRSLWKNNDRSISKFQVQTKELFWQKEKIIASVFKCPDEKQSYQNVFVLSRDKSIIFTMADERFDKSEIRDINKDKIPELIIDHGNSGNCWNCQGQSVFQIVNDAVKDLFLNQMIPEGGKYANVWLSDVNNDGIEDVLVTNDNWEISDGFFHSNAPSHTGVLTWKDGKYQRVGSLFSKYYLNQIKERNIEMDKLLKDKATGLNDIVSLAIENYWDYQEIDQTVLGWKNFMEQINLDKLPKTIKVSAEEKTWLEGVKMRIKEEYKTK